MPLKSSGTSYFPTAINRPPSLSHILSWKLPIRLSQGISPVFIFHFYFLRTDSFIRSATKNGFSRDLARRGQTQNRLFPYIYCTLFTYFFLYLFKYVFITPDLPHKEITVFCPEDQVISSI